MRIHMCVKLRDKGVLVPKPGQQSSWCSALAIISLFLNVLRIWTLCSQRSRKPVYITDRLWSLFLFYICDHFFPWICLVYFYTSQRMSLENAQHKKKKRFKYTFIVPKQVKSVIVGLRKWWKFLDAAKPPPPPPPPQMDAVQTSPLVAAYTPTSSAAFYFHFPTDHPEYTVFYTTGHILQHIFNNKIHVLAVKATLSFPDFSFCGKRWSVGCFLNQTKLLCWQLIKV